VRGAFNRAIVNDFDPGRTTHRRDKTFFVYDKDEHPALLGEDRGANPVEYLLVGLAGRVTTTLVYLAAARGITLTRSMPRSTVTSTSKVCSACPSRSGRATRPSGCG